MIVFEITREEAQLIINAVAELPYRVSAELITKLLQQATKATVDDATKSN